MTVSSRRSLVSFMLITATSCGAATAVELTRPGLPDADAAFITGAGQAANAELISGKLALSTSKNPDVRAFAKAMIVQNGQLNAALAKVGTAVGHPAPTGVDTSAEAKAAQLRGLRGPAFDKAYADSEVGGHMLDVDKHYRPELANGGNAKVKAFAAAYEPRVQAQLKAAEALQTHDHL